MSEFTVWGEFVRAWGWDVVESGPGNTGTGFEICVAADGDVCKAGTTGAGAGQFGSPQGVAVDSVGNVYVADRGLPSNQRVQKFDPEGNFLLMWGKEVNSGTGANKEVCTNAGPPTDVCGAGGEGIGPGQFGLLSTVGDYIDIDTKGTASALDDEVWVGEVGRIQRFDTAGSYLGEIAVAGETVKGLAVDPVGDLYAFFCGASCAGGTAAKAGVRKLSAAGAELHTVAVANPQGVASGPSGGLYALDGGSVPTIRKYSPGGAEVFEEETIFPFFPTFPFAPGLAVASTGIAIGYGCHTAPAYDLYVSNAAEAPNGFLRAYGPPPDEIHVAEFENCEPPRRPPSIEDQGVVSVRRELAGVRATINPQFWADTSYRVQYATVECLGGEAEDWGASCVQEKPTEDILLDAGVTDKGIDSKDILLQSLEPGTEYRFRFTAQSRFDAEGIEVNEKGGPVFGLGGTEAEDGAAGSFTTRTAPPAPETNCPNQDLRSGAGAFLPDCRAYEMVSPEDKNGGDIRPSRPTSYIQATRDGSKITYSASAAFAGQPSNKIYNQYLAERGGGGWASRGINLPLGRQLENEAIIYPTREVSAFSPDLCSEWLVDFNVTPLIDEALPDYVNLYEQNLCGNGKLEALLDDPPLNGPKLFYVDSDSIQGFSEGLSHVFIVAPARLIDEAANTVNRQIYVYEPASGELHVVSVLPEGTADSGQLTAGGGVGGGVSGEFGGNVLRAVSENGSRAYWSSAISYPSQGGKRIYLRTHPEQGIVSGECTDPSKACTVAVSSGDATFWGATPDGSEALYSEGNLGEEGGGATLHRFNAETEESTPVVEGLRGVLGSSQDLSRIYYVSTEDLTPGEPNGQGEEAQEGEPNLYLDEEGEVSFVARLMGGVEGDVAGGVDNEQGPTGTYRIASFNPRFNAARTTPDGSRIVFQSRAPLTGYDNVDSGSGERATEVFTYEAGGELHCVSCDPSNQRPAGRELAQAFVYPLLSKPTGVWAAAWIPGFEHPLHGSNVLSGDGGRIFFNSNVPLVARDTNKAQDVYQWEAPGSGGCEAGKGSYREANGGCVDLISSGKSGFESEFWDASESGGDVFFTTESSLVAKDPGQIDLYDARVGGGFPEPEPPSECEGEACANAAPPPEDPTPASAAFRGPANEAGGANPCRRSALRAKRLARGAGKLRRAARRSPAPRRAQRLRRRAKGAAKRARRASRAAKRCRARARAGRRAQR